MGNSKTFGDDNMMFSDDVLSSTSECIVVISLDYRYGQFNPAFLNAFNDTPESLFNVHLSERVGDQMFQELLKPALDECFLGKNVSLQYWRDLPGSGMRFLDLRYDPLYDASGSVVGAVSGVRDITDIIHGEESTRYSEVRFKDFAETAADWFWEKNSSDCYTFLSERFELITGLSTTEVIGKTLDSVLSHPLEYTEESLVGRKKFLDRKAYKVTCTLHRPDGEPRIITISGKPRFDDGGRFIGYRGTGRDITDAYQLSKRLKYQATHDALTGLINRREFERQLQACCKSTE